MDGDKVEFDGKTFNSQAAADLYAKSRPHIKPARRKTMPISAPPADADKALCRSCGRVAVSGTPLKGHVLITLVLLCFYLVPGIIYMIWRRVGCKPVCAVCGSEDVIPLNSPQAQRIMAQAQEQADQTECPFCKERIKRAAIKCKHCGSDLSGVAAL